MTRCGQPLSTPWPCLPTLASLALLSLYKHNTKNITTNTVHVLTSHFCKIFSFLGMEC